MANYHSQQSDMARHKPARIGTLAVLPVFFNLRGKRVLVIGGGEPAVWKAELLAQAGASVAVISTDTCSEMLALAEQAGLQGSIELLDREWSLEDLDHSALVVADVRSDGEAKAIYSAARSAGIPVNVIDKPEFCTFQFGTIVNRSPVVIGISTDGAAPVLGQAIRTRIESVLPQTLARWAAHAKDIRSVVLSQFDAGSERRRFWSHFATLSFGAFVPDHVWNCGKSSIMKAAVNSIYVDPLDPDLLTLKSIRLLQSADVIYFESDIGEAVLDHARREAQRICFNGNVTTPHQHMEIETHLSEGRQVTLILSNTVSRGFRFKTKGQKFRKIRSVFHTT
jgi:uroporphyrin-III C-methyltransferase / precorrin-2 dehydrogenase / sirohydrochlorin ferrochelatase